jgi:hypothetical protein
MDSDVTIAATLLMSALLFSKGLSDVQVVRLFSSMTPTDFSEVLHVLCNAVLIGAASSAICFQPYDVEDQANLSELSLPEKSAQVAVLEARGFGRPEQGGSAQSETFARRECPSELQISRPPRGQGRGEPGRRSAESQLLALGRSRPW